MNQKSKWDRKYEDRLNKNIEIAPNPRLVALSSFFKGKGGRAADIACGLGSNSLFLGELSFKVEAYDISEVAVNFIKEKAEGLKLQVEPFLCDLTDVSFFEEKKSTFDLVIMTYYLDRSLFPIVKKLLRENGYFFMETYYLSQDHSDSRVSDQYKLHSQELLREFRDLQVLYFEENEQEGRQTILVRKCRTKD